MASASPWRLTREPSTPCRQRCPLDFPARRALIFSNDKAQQTAQLECRGHRRLPRVTNISQPAYRDRHWRAGKKIMTWLRIASAAAIGFYALLSATLVHAQDVPRAFLCGNLVGSYTGPTTSWKPEKDGSSNQEVLLYFKGDKSLSSVKWYRDGKVYYESRRRWIPQ